MPAILRLAVASEQPWASATSSLRFAIYARYSSTKQQETSIEDQVRRCRDYIQRSGEDASAARVFSDSAISGASLERPDFESMMREVAAGRIKAIVTEDMSRISRDFADSALIFKKLQYAQVPLIGVADGIDTGQKNSKLSFTFKSLLSDLYLDDLRDKTLRGLKGRALAGRATGNVPYGYMTSPAADGLGAEIRIDDEFATIVRRIFQLFENGHTYKGIAMRFNREGIPAPRAKTKHGSRGWPHTTIRSMLLNERYVGVWTYNEREWVKRPGTNKRTPRSRDASEIIRRVRPDLRIIEESTWKVVQARLDKSRRRYTGKAGRRTASVASRAVYPLSGLLRCPCGVSLTIYGGTKSSKRYRCPDNYKRGTCDNALGLREDIARKVILEGVRSRLLRPTAVEFIRSELARLLGAANRDVDTELTRRRKLLSRTEGKIGGLIEFIATGDKSEYVVTSLRDLEALAKTEQAAIKSLERQATKPVALPSPPLP
ncbi:MAG: recombinase family protein [Myxococcales bacterium]|nr:recombinase family protein [Myxococcales bacterium]